MNWKSKLGLFVKVNFRMDIFQDYKITQNMNIQIHRRDITYNYLLFSTQSAASRDVRVAAA